MKIRKIWAKYSKSCKPQVLTFDSYCEIICFDCLRTSDQRESLFKAKMQTTENCICNRNFFVPWRKKPSDTEIGFFCEFWLCFCNNFAPKWKYFVEKRTRLMKFRKYRHKKNHVSSTYYDPLRQNMWDFANHNQKRYFSCHSMCARKHTKKRIKPVFAHRLVKTNRKIRCPHMKYPIKFWKGANNVSANIKIWNLKEIQSFSLFSHLFNLLAIRNRRSFASTCDVKIERFWHMLMLNLPHEMHINMKRFRIFGVHSARVWGST